MGEDVCKKMLDKGLISKIYETLYQYPIIQYQKKKKQKTHTHTKQPN